MGEEGTFYKGVFLVAVTFTLGVGVGYKVGTVRSSYIKLLAPDVPKTKFNSNYPDPDCYDGSSDADPGAGEGVEDGVAEEEEGEAGGEAAGDAEGDRADEDELITAGDS